MILMQVALVVAVGLALIQLGATSAWVAMLSLLLKLLVAAIGLAALTIGAAIYWHRTAIRQVFSKE